jgi:hypothetical protein
MTSLLRISTISATLALAACGGNGDDKLAERVEDRADARADEMENKADALDARAEAVRERGEDRADAIDAADVNADKMTVNEKNAVVVGDAPAVR